MKSVVAVIASLSLLASAGCEQQKSPITSSTDGTRYENEYFEFSVLKPAGWHSQDAEATMKLTKKGANVMTGDDQNRKAVVDEALRSAIPIFGFFESVPGTPTKTNPNVISVAENISAAPGVKSGCDYLFHARQFMQSSAVKMTISEGCKTAEINGTTFGYLDVKTEVNGMQVLQRYYACVRGEHAISMIQTFFDESSKAKVDAVVNSVAAKCV